MEQYIIRGGNPLVGEVEISGAKNAALGILAAAIMTDDTVLIENLPDVRDINVLLEAMESIGVKVERLTRHAVLMNSEHVGEVSVEYEYIKKIRASYYLIAVAVSYACSGYFGLYSKQTIVYSKYKAKYDSRRTGA